MKVLFLDIDGVLNSIATFKSRSRNGRERIDPACVQLLDQVIDATDARIVVSSTWRFSGLDYVRHVLVRFGLRNADAIMDVTPRLPAPVAADAALERGLEIGAWLRGRQDVEAFAIVDDDADMGPFLPRLVQTSFETGMTGDHTERLIALLNGTDAAPRCMTAALLEDRQ